MFFRSRFHLYNIFYSNLDLALYMSNSIVYRLRVKDDLFETLLPIFRGLYSSNNLICTVRVIPLVSELPLYLLLGIFCGIVSLALSWCTSYMMEIFDNLHKATGIPRASFPVLGGLSVGLIALAYPEILYWGFENVDILLESRPLLKGLSTDLLLQLIGIKIFATSLCRASGLVGGYYAPSLFIGAATGMAYGKFIGFVVAEFNPAIHLSVLEVASPQAYGLVTFYAFFPFLLYNFYL